MKYFLAAFLGAIITYTLWKVVGFEAVALGLLLALFLNVLWENEK